MTERSSIYFPGDHVIALCGRGDGRSWRPGIVRSVDAASARVDLGAGARRIPLARLRLGAAR